MSKAPRRDESLSTLPDNVSGLRRRLALKAQGEIDHARAIGDHETAELVTLRMVNYPAYVAEMAAREARESAARVAHLPLGERMTATAQPTRPTDQGE